MTVDIFSDTDNIMDRYAQSPLTDLELICTDGSLYFSRHAMSLISSAFAASLLLTYEVTTINTGINMRTMKLALDLSSSLMADCKAFNEEIANAFVYMYKMGIITTRITDWIKNLKDNKEVLIMIASMNPDALSTDDMGKEFLKILSWEYKKVPVFKTGYNIFDICVTKDDVYRLYKKVECERTVEYWQCIAGKLSNMYNIKPIIRKMIAGNVLRGEDVSVMAPLIQLLKSVKPVKK